MSNLNYDSCISIDNPDKFFAAITDSPLLGATYEGVFPCKYVSRIFTYNSRDKTHPALIKDPKHHYQHEVRAIWRPQRNIPIKPKILMCPEISKYCSLIK